MIQIPKKLEYAVYGKRNGEAINNQSTSFCWIPSKTNANPIGKNNGQTSRHMFHEAFNISGELFMLWLGQNPKIMNDTPKTIVKIMIADIIVDFFSACAPNPIAICGLDMATKGHQLTGKNIPASTSASICISRRIRFRKYGRR